MLQTLVARPAGPAGDAHGDLAACDDETRGWALVALHDAGWNPSAARVRVGLTDRSDVPVAQRAEIPRAPNARPEPDPVFARSTTPAMRRPR